MSVSHATVHPVPVEAPPPQTEDANAPLAAGVRMKDFQGMGQSAGLSCASLSSYLRRRCSPSWPPPVTSLPSPPFALEGRTF